MMNGIMVGWCDVRCVKVGWYVGCHDAGWLDSVMLDGMMVGLHNG